MREETIVKAPELRTCDGSRINTGLASAGGLPRDYTGRWIGGYGTNVGSINDLIG